MRRTIVALSALALAGGCDPGDFGAALDKAPVQYISAPSGFGSNVGRTLLALPPPQDRPTVAARLLFAGTDTASLAWADFDGDGKAHVQSASGDDLRALIEPSDQSQGGITSAAWLNGPGAAGTILLGMPNLGSGAPAGRIAFLNLGADTSVNVALQQASLQPGASTDGPAGTQPRGHFGLAVARGQVTQTTNDETNDEAIVVSDNGVSVLSITNGLLASTTCTGALATPLDRHRSLAVGNFLDDADGVHRQEIAVGLPVKGGTGKVFILRYGINPASPSSPPGLFCAGTVNFPDQGGIPAVGGYGTALAAVDDLNGDGLAELVVGAPPDRAYLFYSPFDGSPKYTRFTKVRVVTVSGVTMADPNTPDSASEFGQRVALVDIDGDGSKELAVTALQADVGGTPKAGQVLVYRLPGAPVEVKTPIAVVYDSNPIANTGFFGIGLADLEFDSSRVCPNHKDGGQQDKHVLVVGDDLGIFAFFRFAGIADPTTAITRDDPRCFAQ
jgi:hypothetical protein